MAVLEPDAAGIDIGAQEIYVAVPPDRDEQTTRVFRSFTYDLQALADWLHACGFALWRWSRPACTGYLSIKFSSSAASRYV